MQNEEKNTQPQAVKIHKIQFRNDEQVFSASTQITNLKQGEVVMIQTDHNLEPAHIIGTNAYLDPEENSPIKTSYILQRRATRDEIEKYDRLVEREQEAFSFCQDKIEQHKLSMKLIKVERFFNGSKIIFYFTAENRVDFRQLVKDLVQEFRTRVEMRQIGVRHETKMVGGLGCCGRELCCSSYINDFSPVSIKMAKEQSLPLNPVKISGICNRLLCCLTYEYPTYRALKKELPRPGKKLKYEGKKYKVIKQNILEGSILVIELDSSDPPRLLSRQEWEAADYKSGEKGQKPGRSRKKTHHKSDKKDRTTKSKKK